MPEQEERKRLSSLRTSFACTSKYAERQGWRVELLESHSTGIGGFKEIIASVEGPGVYRTLKYESGTHRVQRVPVTESQGRIHTSAVTVAILPEAEEVEVAHQPGRAAYRCLPLLGSWWAERQYDRFGRAGHTSPDRYRGQLPG